MNYKYCTYKFYAEDGRRIAAFAEETEQSDKLKITLIYCSKQDQFSKKKAKYIHARLNNKISDLLGDFGCPDCLYHPEIFTITVNSKTPKKDFISYMFNNYYVKREKIVKCWIEVLEGPKGMKTTSTPKQIFKMDKAW